jgi:pimeloyl-ACP methyl ester carboxylesterase
VETLANPGAICLSDNAYQQIKGKLSLDVADLGKQQLKNIAQPMRVYSVQPHEAAARPAHPSRAQQITFCRTTDGINLAVAYVGKGMPLVSIPTWLTHIEYDWQNPGRAPLWRFLADRFRLIRYDGRGFGLSDHDVTEVSLILGGRVCHGRRPIRRHFRSLGAYPEATGDAYDSATQRPARTDAARQGPR